MRSNGPYWFSTFFLWCSGSDIWRCAGIIAATSSVTSRVSVLIYALTTASAISIWSVSNASSFNCVDAPICSRSCENFFFNTDAERSAARLSTTMRDRSAGFASDHFDRHVLWYNKRKIKLFSLNSRRKKLLPASLIVCIHIFLFVTRRRLPFRYPDSNCACP